MESRGLFRRAERLIPGGVNSPVRAFHGVGGEPFFVDRAEGCRLWDVEGRAYIDFVGSWGPLILGHAAGAKPCSSRRTMASRSWSSMW